MDVLVSGILRRFPVNRWLVSGARSLGQACCERASRSCDDACLLLVATFPLGNHKRGITPSQAFMACSIATLLKQREQAAHFARTQTHGQFNPWGVVVYHSTALSSSSAERLCQYPQRLPRTSVPCRCCPGSTTRSRTQSFAVFEFEFSSSPSQPEHEYLFHAPSDWQLRSTPKGTNVVVAACPLDAAA